MPRPKKKPGRKPGRPPGRPPGSGGRPTNKGYAEKVRAHLDKFPEQAETVPTKALAAALGIESVGAVQQAKLKWKKNRLAAAAAGENQLAAVQAAPSNGHVDPRDVVEMLLEIAADLRGVADNIVVKATQQIK